LHKAAYACVNILPVCIVLDGMMLLFLVTVVFSVMFVLYNKNNCL